MAQPRDSGSNSPRRAFRPAASRLEIVNQLKQVHGRTEMAREKICAAGPASASMAGPSLSEALGTSRPTLENKRTGANTFDTLTGNAIQK